MRTVTNAQINHKLNSCNKKMVYFSNTVFVVSISVCEIVMVVINIKIVINFVVVWSVRVEINVDLGVVYGMCSVFQFVRY